MDLIKEPNPAFNKQLFLQSLVNKSLAFTTFVYPTILSSTVIGTSSLYLNSLGCL